MKVTSVRMHAHTQCTIIYIGRYLYLHSKVKGNTTEKEWKESSSFHECTCQKQDKAALDKVHKYRLTQTLKGSTGIELRRVKISAKVWTSSRRSNTPLTRRYNWDVFQTLGVGAKLPHNGAQQQHIGRRGRLECC